MRRVTYIEELIDNLTIVVLESALEVGRKAPKENQKIFNSHKDFIRNCCKMEIKIMQNKIEQLRT